MRREIPHGYSEIVEFFGDPHFASGSVDSRWEQASMILVRDLPGVPKLYCHRLIVEPLREALVESQKLGYRPTTIGCFAPRAKRGSSQLSLHTFGAAVDLDAATNPLALNCPAGDPRRDNFTIPREVIAAWKKIGWFWGGDFMTRFDPMHFQWATGY